jgi:hypothetical protein
MIIGGPSDPSRMKMLRSVLLVQYSTYCIRYVPCECDVLAHSAAPASAIRDDPVNVTVNNKAKSTADVTLATDIKK